MPKYRIKDVYSMNSWWEKVVEVEASTEEEAIEKYHEDEGVVISDEETDSEHGSWSEIQDVWEIE